MYRFTAAFGVSIARRCAVETTRMSTIAKLIRGTTCHR
jgi:hypothetical protein